MRSSGPPVIQAMRSRYLRRSHLSPKVTRVSCGAAVRRGVGLTVVSPYTGTTGSPGERNGLRGGFPFAVIARIKSLGSPFSLRAVPGLSALPPGSGSPRRSFGPAPSITSQTIFTLHDSGDGPLGSKARPAQTERRVCPKPAASRDGGAHASRSWRKAIHWRWPAGGPVENRSISDRHAACGGRVSCGDRWET
jgi:hypothetical protein